LTDLGTAYRQGNSEGPPCRYGARWAYWRHSGWSVTSIDGLCYVARANLSCIGHFGHILDPRHGREAGRPTDVFCRGQVRTAVPPAFDPANYIDTVLRPLGREGSGKLPDLVVRYALDQWPPEASDEDLMTQIDQVVDLWRRQEEGGTAGLAEACARCLVEDDKLRHQAAYLDPRWWRGRIREGQGLGQLSDLDDLDQLNGQRPEPTSPSSDDAVPSADDTARNRQPPPPELPPPAGLTVATGDDCVILRWQAPPAAPADTKFTIERLSGTGTWQFLAATPGTTMEDTEPLAGRAVTYRVLAEHAPSGARSNPAFAEVLFTPPVTDLAAEQVRDGSVVGRWRTHPDTGSVDVRRTPRSSQAHQASGTTIPTQAGGFVDPHPSPGRYVYSIEALYLDPDTDQTYRGRPAEVEVEVFDEPPQPWVSLGESREHESARVTLRWSVLPDDMFLLMRRSAMEPAGVAGDLLMLAEAEQVGLPLFNSKGITGTTANLALPAGRWVLIPFAVACRRAVRGDCLHVDVVPPVTVPEAVRNGRDVQVSWAWPSGLRLARVVWRADGVDVLREIARSEFQGRGSVTFRRPEAASIRITGLVRSGVDELISAVVTVTAPSQLPTLTYRVRRVPSLPGLLPWSRRRRVVLATDLPCAGLRAVIYVHAPSRGQECDIELAVLDDLDLGPDRSHHVMVTLPKAGEIVRPCYLSCRATAGFGEVRVDQFASRGREIR
jgi:hypothetical protein